jgi:hypothetical protein
MLQNPDLTQDLTRQGTGGREGVCVCVFYKATRIQSWGLTPITLSTPHHLPKTPPVNTAVGLSFTLLTPHHWD